MRVLFFSVISLSLIIGTVSPAAPGAPTVAPTVAPAIKVLSSGHNGPARGSGWPIRIGSDLYIVTSEHVLAPVNISSRADVLWKGQDLQAVTVAMDWSVGLALLKLKKPNPEVAATAIDFSSAATALTVGATVDVFGFPFAQIGEPLVTQGEISVVDSSRPFLPMTRGLELTNSYAEFGMSGAPVFLHGQQDLASFVGILSHRIPRVENGPDSIVDFDQSGNARHLFLIPRATVFAFVKSGLANGPSLFRRLSWVDEPLQVEVGGLIFQEQRSPLDGIKETLFIPRLEGMCSGGGDCVGVGGEGEVRPEDSVQIQVRLDTAHATAPWPFAASTAAATTWRNFLLKRVSVTAVSIIDQDQRQNLISGMEEFFAKWIGQSARPVISGPELQKAQTVTAARILLDRQHAQATLQNISQSISRVGGDGSADRLLRQTSALLNLATSANAGLLAPGAFEQLLDIKGEYASEWRALFVQDFDRTEDFMTALTDLSAALKLL